MGLIDLNGNKILTGGGSDFFNVSYPIYTNLFNGEREQGWYSSGSTFNSSVTAASTSDYIELPDSAKYVYSQIAQRVIYNPDRVVVSAMAYFAMTFFDSNKTFISTLRPTGGAVGTEGNYTPMEVPNGAKYVRVAFGGAYMNRDGDYFVGVAEDNSSALLPWEDYYEPGKPKSAYIRHENLTYKDKPLHEGKKWLLFGDSLTDSYGGHDWQESTSPVGGDGWKDTEERVPWTGYFWASRIVRELGLVLDNRAESGSNINIGSNGNYADVCGINILNAFIAEIDAGAEPPDYITIGFGSNAIVSQLGTAEDTAETTTTVCGAVKYFIKTLREKCPNAAIGFVLPPQSDWGDTSTVKSVEQGRAAIKSVLDLDEYSVPYVDMWKESGITVDMLPDGIHVSSKQANNLYYHAMRRFMMGL